ncbi:MAG: trehalose-6-phosphate synthase, partial [Ktedonobacterales bacterium]
MGKKQAQALQAAQEEIATLTQGRRLIVVTNRGPVEFHHEAGGKLAARSGPGGVVTALASLASTTPLTWVAVTLTDGDREAFPTPQTPARKSRVGLQPIRVRYTPVAPETQRMHYDEVSNGILWFLQHYMWDTANTPNFTERQYRAWDEGYCAVNQAVAQMAIEEATAEGAADGSGAIILLQDYQLYLAPALIRARLPRASIQQFIHIPWPAVRYWGLLPQRMLDDIFTGLAANDVLGFQTERDVRNFLVCAQMFLPDCHVDFVRDLVTCGKHKLLARAYPIPVDAGEVRRSLASAAGQRGALEVAKLLGDDKHNDNGDNDDQDMRLIVRVDRLEPTKNIVRGFKAYEALLRDHEELRGRVRFLAFLIPSRQGLPIYRRYDREVRALIKRINTTYGTRGWQPINAFFENNRPRALAALQRYDALLVNPVIDGMNLVVKEGAAINETNGVAILSRTAGAYTQMADATLAVTATDIEETKQQLYHAL